MNEALGNVGQTVTYTQTSEPQPSNQRADMQQLVADMNAGTVELLLIVDANPVYSAPADLNFKDAMQKVAVRAHLGLYEDETAAESHWHIPAAHFSKPGATYAATRERYRSFSRSSRRCTAASRRTKSSRRSVPTASVRATTWSAPTGQGSVCRRRACSSAGCAGARAAPGSCNCDRARDPASGRGRRSRRAAVNTAPATFQPAPERSPFENAWRKWLHDGLIPGTAFEARGATLSGMIPAASAVPPAGDVIDITFRPDASVHDGRFSNNAGCRNCRSA
jgi:molybdopterin-containing oxidoreductase family iron-sulfur binding subunit